MAYQRTQRQTTPNPDFARLISIFRRISAISDPIDQRFELNLSAAGHDQTRAEMRRMFAMWIAGGQQ
jgi:hypothetical protein